MAHVKRCLPAGAFDYVETLRLCDDLPATVDRAVRVIELPRARLAHECEVERLRDEERRLLRSPASASAVHAAPVPTPSRRADTERHALGDALRLAHGTLAAAARVLGVTKVSCWRKVHEHARTPAVNRRP